MLGFNRLQANENISRLRNSGLLEDAIQACQDAIKQDPQNYFYYKIVGDLYFQIHSYDLAMQFYLEFFKRINNQRELFNDFARRYNRLKMVITKVELDQFNNIIESTLKSYTMPKWIKDECIKLIKHNDSIGYSPEILKFIPLISDDINFNKTIKEVKNLEDTDRYLLEFIIDHYIMQREYHPKTQQTDMYFISVCERLGKYNQALEIANRILTSKNDDSVIIRTMFRICRKMDNYEYIDKILSKYPDILKNNNFNILYELIYYYEKQKDSDRIYFTLKKIEKYYPESASINQTLKNFYLKFGLLEDVKGIIEKINNLQKKGARISTKYSDELQESELGIWSTIRELNSEVEHQKQLNAISELTRGISHELGQPITNIRYTVQFYQRFLNGELDKDQLNTAFNSILEETERMGALVKRLSPLTSSKSIIETFDIVKRIKKRIDAENLKLDELHINISVEPQKPVLLTSDPIKFEQIISNLLVNSIYAIKQKCTINNKIVDNYIKIKVSDLPNEIRIIFEDSGIGVSLEHRRKIFDPFYSTKPPGEGEGLGLFIIWNILKMQGGKINLDFNFNNGAKFLISIPRRRLSH